MAELVRNRRVYIKAESTFGVEAGSTNGSDMTFVPVMSVGPLNDGKEMIDAPQQLGHWGMTEKLAGADGGSFDISFAWMPLSGAAGSNTNPPSADAYDLLLQSALGATTAFSGSNFTTISATSITFSQAAFAQGAIPLIYDDDISMTPTRSQPILLHSASNGGATIYGYENSFQTSATATDLAYGSRRHALGATGSQGTGTLTISVAQDATIYTFKGCRAVLNSFSCAINGVAEIKMTVHYDTRTEETSVKTSLPAVRPRPYAPVQGLTCRAILANSNIAFKNVEITFNPRVQPIQDQSATHAKSDIAVFGYDPVIKIETLYSNTYLDLRRNATKGRLIIQMGSGIPTTVGAITVVPAVVVHAPSVQVSKADPTEDENVQRQSLEFTPVLSFASGSSSPTTPFEIYRY